MLLFASSVTYAQGVGFGGGPEKKDFSFEAYKKGLEDFVAKGAELTCQESEKLFPMLYEMLMKKKQLSDQQRALYKDIFHKDLSDEEYESIINKSLDYDIQINKLEKSYYKKFHTVISWKKVFRVRHAIYAYQMGAMHQFRKKPGKGNGGAK